MKQDNNIHIIFKTWNLFLLKKNLFVFFWSNVFFFWKKTSEHEGKKPKNKKKNVVSPTIDESPVTRFIIHQQKVPCIETLRLTSPKPRCPKHQTGFLHWKK